MPARLVVLASGAGTTLQAVLDAEAGGDLGARVVAVVVDRAGCGAEERARAARRPVEVVLPGDYPDRATWDAAASQAVARHRPDLVFSAGFMRVLGPDFLARFGGRTVNTHPSLLPRFPGRHAVRDALAAGVPTSGATVHWVDAGVDTGPVIAQVEVEVRPGDDEASLTARIQAAERRLVVDTLRELVAPVTDTRRPLRRALVSVYDKSGLDDLALGLHRAGVVIVSTGSTAEHIRAAGVPVTPVSEVTGFPEILGGRVKTLHPHVHAGLLADLRKPEHVEVLREHGIEPFDLLVANLYPFRETVAAGAGTEETVEQIDIGGPAMIRAAAKNHPSVAVVVDPADYGAAVRAAEEGGFDLEARRVLAATAFAHTASYDAAVANWFAGHDPLPPYVGIGLERAEVLRYGENPHQSAALYLDRDATPGLAQAEQLNGKAMSYNNYVDTDAAWRAAHDFPGQVCVAVVKHANPCGIAVGADVAEAHRLAHACDPVSAFGGVIATNVVLTAAAARQISEVFTEVVAAPDFEDEALAVLTVKANLRVLRCPVAARRGSDAELRRISGGFLLQEPDLVDAPGDDPATWTLQSGEPVAPDVLADLGFAWRAVRAVKSNAILLARGGATVGIGMGQVNRVDAARLAVARAGDRAGGSVAASDAFFPFPDGLEVLLEAGVRAVVEPGGSVRDDVVVAAAAAAGVPLYFTGTRHFAH